MNPDERYEHGHNIGFFHGLSSALIEASKADTVVDAMSRISALMVKEVA